MGNKQERVDNVIIRENVIDMEGESKAFMIKTDTADRDPSEIIFFDLEHYVYKKPKCIGVFGACTYNANEDKLYVTQYMLENKGEVVDVLLMAKKYFVNMKRQGKKAIVTFSGNNDFTVINYLFNKYSIEFDFSKEYESIDIQKEYEKMMNSSIGLKNLEKLFEIHREGEVISGSNLAKTFHKIMKDREYILRMPHEKVENILLYNEQDVVNLYKIYISWSKFINEDKLKEREKELEQALKNEDVVDEVAEDGEES